MKHDPPLHTSDPARELQRAIDKGDEPAPKKSMPAWAIVVFVLVGLGMLMSTFQALGLLPR
jgi:hypothetical protein